MCMASESNQAAWAPTPRSEKVETGVQEAVETGSPSGHCDWESSGGVGWDARTWRVDSAS